MAGLCAPLSTLRQHPRRCRRMTRGQCGSLDLHCERLALSTPCRSSRRTAFLVYMLPPLPRCSGWAYSSLISPSRLSLPRKGHRVGLHIVLFEACSAFTRVAACTLARSPIRDPLSEGFRHFVSSMPAPIASGGSESPGGPCTHRKAPPCHGAHPFRTFGPERVVSASLSLAELYNRVLQCVHAGVSQCFGSAFEAPKLLGQCRDTLAVAVRFSRRASKHRN